MDVTRRRRDVYTINPRYDGVMAVALSETLELSITGHH